MSIRTTQARSCIIGLQPHPGSWAQTTRKLRASRLMLPRLLVQISQPGLDNLSCTKKRLSRRQRLLRQRLLRRWKSVTCMTRGPSAWACHKIPPPRIGTLASKPAATITYVRNGSSRNLMAAGWACPPNAMVLNGRTEPKRGPQHLLRHCLQEMDLRSTLPISLVARRMAKTVSLARTLISVAVAFTMAIAEKTRDASMASAIAFQGLARLRFPMAISSAFRKEIAQGSPAGVAASVPVMRRVTPNATQTKMFTDTHASADKISALRTVVALS